LLLFDHELVANSAREPFADTSLRFQLQVPNCRFRWQTRVCGNAFRFGAVPLCNLRFSVLRIGGHNSEGFRLNDNSASKDEQWKLQQEILQQRKDKSKMKDHFSKVNDARKKISEGAQKSLWSRADDSVDPIEQWKAAKKRGEIKPLGYEAEPARNASKLGLNIIVPLNPMGIPQYDNGERFDLRLPYAERGYEDESADVMGAIGNAVKGWFGLKPKQK
jgi:hypothetical protein